MKGRKSSFIQNEEEYIEHSIYFLRIECSALKMIKIRIE